MLAVELVRDKHSKEPRLPSDDLCAGIHTVCREQGVWVRIQGNKMILSPPLVFERGHVDEAINAIRGAFEKLDS